MTKKTLWLSLPLCMVIALLAAFLFVSPAFAQDEVPPEVVPTEAPAEALPAEAMPTEIAPEEVIPTEAPAEVLPTESVPVEEPLTEAAPVEEAPVAEPSLAEALDASDVMLADNSGEPLTLAASSSEDLVATGDPYFTVGSIKYRFYQAGYGGCGSDPYCFVYVYDPLKPEIQGPIQAALDYMKVHNLTPTNRTLYIQEDTYNEFVDVDGSQPGVRGLLAIEGVAAVAGGIVDPEQVIINGQLHIHNFASGFSISNLSVYNTVTPDSAAILAENNSGIVKLTNVNARADGEDSSGIIIEKSGAELNGVNASGNAAHGAMLLPAGTAAVKITNSAFDNNAIKVIDGNSNYGSIYLGLQLDGTTIINEEDNRSGLLIKTLGSVTINGISASGNQGDGVFITTGSAVSVKNSVLNENLWSGLFAYKNPLTLDNILASYNGAGIVQNDGISFTGTYVTTDNNYWKGIYIDTCFLDGSSCLNSGAGTVTLKYTGSTNNGDDGLEILAKGAVTITDGFFGYNGVNGIYVNNAVSSLTPAVTITGVDTPGNRAEGTDCATSVCAGIKVESRGVVALKDFKTADNTGDGIYIDNQAGTGAVTISAPTGTTYRYSASILMNETNNNGGNGYTILSKGAVTATNVDAWQNGNLGGFIDNSKALSAAAVTINKVGPVSYGNRFFENGNGEAGDGGLKILSRGAVNISRLVVSNNNGFGAVIKNVPTGTLPGVPVTVNSSEFSRNTSNGLDITSRGAVNISFVGVDSNSGFGAKIDNDPKNISLPAAAVTISDSSFDRQGFGEDGLRIVSKGQITLLNIRANYNGGYGVYLDNQVPGATAGVTINAGAGKGNEFQGNRLSGLVIRTNGAATMTNLYAANNGFNTFEALGDFTIETHLLFEPDSNFQFSGLVIYQDINNFLQFGRAYCDLSGPCVGNGIYFDSVVDGIGDGGNFATAITSLSEVYLRLIRAGNTIEGWYREDGGNWTFLGSHETPSEFQVNGVGLAASQDFYKFEPEKASDFNYFELSSPYVLNDFDGSLGDGWVWVNENSNYWNLDEAPGFLRIYNSTTSTHYQNLLLKTAGMGYGAEIDAKGAVTIKQVGGWGVENNWAEGNVFDNNATGGLKILSKGLVTLANIRANNNGGYGAYLDNQVAGATGGVTINASSGKGNEIQWNTLDGLRIMTNGAVTLTNLFASYNSQWNGIDPATGGYGAYIDNFPGTAAVTIKQVGSWCGNNFCTEGNAFNGNRDGGLWIRTKSAVTVSFFQARENWSTDGILIDADGGAGAVTVSGMPNWGENLAYNGGDGIDVTAKGNISLSKLQASGNNDDGSLLDNCAYDSILDKCLGTGSVTLTDAYFDRNGEDGLLVRSTGVVTWKNGSASNNGSFGAYLINDQGVGKAVTVTNVNASWNFKTGLRIVSKGVVTITDSQADTNSMNKHSIADGEWWKDNLSDGQVWFYEGIKNVKATILVDSSRFTPRITVTDSNRENVILTSDVAGDWYFTPVDDNLTYEILVEAADSWNGFGYEIKLYEGDTAPDWGTITPSEEPANGIFVDNSKGTNTGVTISNAYNRWTSNNSGTDVEVYSSGLITLKGLDLTSSGAGGLIAVNSGATVGTPGVTLTSVNLNSNDGAAVQIDDGGSLVEKLITAYIATKGPVTVKKNDVGGNLGYGYYVDNTYVTAVSPITFMDVIVDGSWGQQLGLGNTGIKLLSRGAVTFTNVRAEGNSGDGMDISTKGAVVFNGIYSSWNWGMGAKVVTDGAFTLNAPAADINWFQNNDLDGLHVEAGGKITLTRVDSRDNGWRDGDGNPLTDAYGIYLESTGAGTGPIVLTEVSTNGCTLDGVRIITKAPVTVNTLSTSGNNGFGLYIDQSTATDSLKPIILNKVFANNNGEDGIHVNAMGSITTNFLSANNNQFNGLYLKNNNSVVGTPTVKSTGTITMLNTLGQNLVVGNGFSWEWNDVNLRWDQVPNGSVGVSLQSYGAVTVNQLETILNGSDGLVVENTNTNPTISIKPAVTLNSVISRQNKGTGIFAKSSGVITINTSWVASNNGDGIAIESNNNVVINNTCSVRNDWAGIRATTTGTPTIKLTNSAWFGNLRDDPDPLDKNLILVGGWILL